MEHVCEDCVGGVSRDKKVLCKECKIRHKPLCHHTRLYHRCFDCNLWRKRSLYTSSETEATHYNNLDKGFIPNEEKKVKDFYRCKRRCFNCGHEGVTSHERGTMAPEAVKCPNCKVLDTFLRG